MNKTPEELLKDNPVVAILRGIQPNEVIEVAQVLVGEGIRVIEVPLNSPDPYTSIKLLCDRFGEHCLCGAGTVISTEQVERVYEAGGKLVVSPNIDPAVIRRSIELGLTTIPGFHTPTEAYEAIRAGAKMLKFFPAAAISLDYLKATRPILPKDIDIVATGGINPDNAGQWLAAGSKGLGIGGDLYRPGINLYELKANARALSDAINHHRSSNKQHR